MRSAALTKAIELVGGRDALAAALGISGPAVSHWERVPAERVLDVEKATDRQVSRTELRPDIYPAEAA
jgi:DNA-binding transcriptional regulator YdaS (Cro superfamily)